MSMSLPGGAPAPVGATTATGSRPLDEKRATLAFEEYKMVAEDTARITDRRQTVNTLFVTINALFLTGVGYLIYTFVQTNGDGSHIVYYALGFLAISTITTLLNGSWQKMTKQSRNLVNLRIRYLETLEKYLREAGYFPLVDTPLRDYETEPIAFPNSEVTITAEDGKVQRRWLRMRGTYSLEEVLYDPKPASTKKKRVTQKPERRRFGFSYIEQRIGAVFNAAYWLAFTISVVATVLEYINYYYSLHFTVGPFHF